MRGKGGKLPLLLSSSEAALSSGNSSSGEKEDDEMTMLPTASLHQLILQTLKDLARDVLAADGKGGLGKGLCHSVPV